MVGRGLAHPLPDQAADFSGSNGPRTIFRQYGVAHEVLGPAELAGLEPDLARRFAHAIWLTESAFVSEPADVLEAYFDRFRELGGSAQRAGVVRLELADTPTAILDDGSRHAADHLVLAAGPWSAALLATLGLRLPMMSERGYVRRFRARPRCRVSTVRSTTSRVGWFLRRGRKACSSRREPSSRCRTCRGSIASGSRAARRASSLLPLGPALAGFDAAADRPTLPDSRPVIGRLAGGPIWLCCGHQHIGFCDGARQRAACWRR